MSTIEDRVRDGLAGAAGDYTPSAELRRTVDRKVRRHRRARIIEVTIATTGVVLFVAGLGVLLATDDDGKEATSVAATTLPADGHSFEVSGLGLDVPNVWTSEPLCGIFGAPVFGGYVSNVGPVEPDTLPGAPPGDCLMAINTHGLPDTYVIVTVIGPAGHPASSRPPTMDESFPIDGRWLVPEHATGQPERQGVVVATPLGLEEVAVMVGPDASDADLAVARQIVESIRPVDGAEEAPTTSR